MTEAAMINIRNLSVKCGHCGTYQTLVRFRPGEEWNVYTYECENDVCDREVTATLLEIPRELDEFARRDPDWHGGARHAGAKARRRREEGFEPPGAGGLETE